MTVAALTWPAAVIHVTWIAAVGLVLAVLISSLFRTGQTAIRKEIGQQDLLESLRNEIHELRAQLQRSGAPS